MGDLASQVRDARMAMHLTQAELAEKAGVHRDTIGAIEAGREIRYATIRAVARAVGLDLGDELADRVRDARKAMGLTQADLAEKTGVSLRTIQGFEAGRTRKPQRSTLNAILLAVDVDPATAPAFTREDAPDNDWPADVELFLFQAGTALATMSQDRRLALMRELTQQVIQRAMRTP